MVVSLRRRSVLRIKFKTTQRKKIKLHKFLSRPASRVAFKVFKLCRRFKELCLQEHEYGEHTIVQVLSRILLNNYSMSMCWLSDGTCGYSPHIQRWQEEIIVLLKIPPPPPRYRKLKYHIFRPWYNVPNTILLLNC